MNVFEAMSAGDYEQVVYTYLPEAGLRSIIAIHDTTLGPALGGCRMYPYATEEEALEDVLRLARGMTYKAAAAGLDLGGGKAVIIGDPERDKSEVLFRAFGRAVETLGGRYITAEDVGTDVLDMEYIAQETDYVTGIDYTRGGSGDPSPFTAFGVLQGILASVEKVYGSPSVEGRTVAVQGLGNVGGHLARLLLDEGARVIGADADEARARELQAEHPKLELVSTDAILETECDVLAPCALGKVINDESIERFRCRVIAGAANNQLQRVEHADALADRDILYAPDYVINAGGLMNVYQELEGYSAERAYRLTRGIFHNVRRLYQLASDEGISTAEAADRLAEERIRSITQLTASLRLSPVGGGIYRRTHQGAATRRKNPGPGSDRPPAAVLADEGA